MYIDSIKIKKFLTFIVILFGTFLFACSNNTMIEESSSVDNNFLEFVKRKNEKFDNISDAYENVEYVKYTDLEKYYSYSKNKKGDKTILYEGDIEYYDKDDNLIKKDEKVTKLISTTDGKIDSEGINSYGYLINCFGMFELDGGFHRYGDNYYYVSDTTHMVAKCSNATMSNAIRENKRKIISKDDGNYIVYADDERNGELVKNSISNIEGDTYLTDENGKIVTEEGIHRTSHIYDDTFHLIYEGLDGKIKKVNDRYFDCYVNKDGKVEVSGKVTVDGKTCCADFDGVLIKNIYITNDTVFDDDMEDTVSDELDNFSLKLIYHMSNYKKLDFSNYKKYTLYSSDIATESNALQRFLGTNISGDAYAFLDGKKVTNDIIRYKDSEYFAGEDGKLLSDMVVTDFKFPLLLDKGGNIVKDRWIFDRQYFDNESLGSDRTPYIEGYDLNREMVKPYLGYYVLPTGEVMTDDVYIESAVFDDNNNILTKFKVKNGEFDYKYDKYFYMINSYDEKYPAYNYEEYDEGKFGYVHRYTDDTRTTRIEDDDIDKQLKYINTVPDYVITKPRKIFRDVVYFGKFYNNDVKGEILEPMEWDILAKNDKNEALLISHYGIENLPFDTGGNNQWKTSSIRKWLNDDFLNMAFTEEEQEKILSNSSDAGREGTNDKVFLLSADEYDKYYKENKNDYIIKIYLPSTKYLDQNAKDISERFNLVTTFWCRNSSGNEAEDSKIKYSETFSFGTKSMRKSNESCAIRPAIWVKFND